MSGAVLQQRYALQAIVHHAAAYDVYAATDGNKGGAACRVELLTAVRATGPAALRIFASAVANAGVVTHGALAPTLDCGVAPDGTPFIVYEALGGELLSMRLSSGPLPPADAVDLAGQLLSALDAAHVKGLAHLDVGLDRVVALNERTKSPRIKLLGLGTTSALVEAHRQNVVAWAPGRTWGDTNHFAPERAIGGHVMGPLDDLWGAAVILYEVLTARPPFEGATPQEVVAQIIGRWQAPPSVVNPKVPAELDPIAFQALHKDPTARFRTAPDFRSALLGAWAKHRFAGVKLAREGTGAGAPRTNHGTQPGQRRTEDSVSGARLFSVPIYKSPDIPEDMTPTSQRFRVVEVTQKPQKP
jgi:serine/threonine-protein kinase